MPQHSELANEAKTHMTLLLCGALDKLKSSMDDGPGGENASISPEESAMLYRTLVDVVGIQHPTGNK